MAIDWKREPRIPASNHSHNPYRDRFNETVLLPLADEYFGATLEGAGEVEGAMRSGRPIIFVGNHSGGSMSWDNVVFQALFDRTFDTSRRRLVRLVHTRLYRDSVAPYCIPQWWRSMGCVEASYDNFDNLLASGEQYVYLSPEGVPGLGKPTWRPARLKQFSSSFVSIAKRYNAIVVPVAVHHSQYLNPATWSWRWTDRLADRTFGWPYLPVGPALPLVALPMFFIQPWPARMTYQFLSPIEFHGHDSIETNRQEAQQVRSMIESALANRRSSFITGTRWRALFARKFNFWSIHARFFEAHAGRAMTIADRIPYLLPVLGHVIVRRRLRLATER